MPAFMFLELPADVDVGLKQYVASNHRSMTQQVIVLLEERMRKFRPVHFGAPIKTRTPLTAKFIDEARKEGRP